MNIRLKSRTVQNLNTNEAEEQSLKLSRLDLIPFQDYARDIAIEFNKVKDSGRCRHLEFSFVRLINANIVFNGNCFWGNNLLSYKRMVQKTCSFLLLGIDYLKKEGKVDSPFTKFDFIDFYKVGKTLITEGQRPLKKILSQKSNLKSFFGRVWENFLEESFERICHFQGEKILDYSIYNEWRFWGKGFLDILPFMNELKKTWDKMVEEGKVQDSFYLNYNLDEINFEVILLSGLANRYLYPSRQTTASVKPKLGLTIEEFKLFAKGVSSLPSLKTLASFYGLSEIPRIEEYLHLLLKEHLEGVDYTALSAEDFRHVGGPIILTL